MFVEMKSWFPTKVLEASFWCNILKLWALLAWQDRSVPTPTPFKSAAWYVKLKSHRLLCLIGPWEQILLAANPPERIVPPPHDLDLRIASGLSLWAGSCIARTQRHHFPGRLHEAPFVSKWHSQGLGKHNDGLFKWRRKVRHFLLGQGRLQRCYLSCLSFLLVLVPELIWLWVTVELPEALMRDARWASCLWSKRGKVESHPRDSCLWNPERPSVTDENPARGNCGAHGVLAFRTGQLL